MTMLGARRCMHQGHTLIIVVFEIFWFSSGRLRMFLALCTAELKC